MLTNHTPLAALARPYRDHKGRNHILLVAKGTWRLSTGRMASAEKQVGLHEQAVRLRIGDLELDAAQRLAMQARQDEQIIWLEHDMSPPKPVFDVIVAGYVTAPDDHHKAYIDASIRIGTQRARMRAFVPRYWCIGWLGYYVKPIVPAAHRVPITYAVADSAAGFPLDPPGASDGLVAAWLPWIESQDATSRRGKHSKAPAGFGYWPDSAAHRQRYTGTCDAAWEKKTAPNLPKDFNPRFYNIAHPDLQLSKAPAGGTSIELTHLAKRAVIECRFPTLSLSVQASTAGGQALAAALLQADTLIIEPEFDRMSVVWRILLPAGTQESTLRSLCLFKTGHL